LVFSKKIIEILTISVRIIGKDMEFMKLSG
jgi:hypothetical protein